MGFIAPNEISSTNSLLISRPYLIKTIPDPGEMASSTVVYRMVGCRFKYTPVMSTTLDITVLCNTQQDIPNTGSNTQICYGTGTPPALNDTFTGTQVGNIFVNATAAGIDTQHVICTAIVPVVINTSYWFDLSSKSRSGGNTTYTNIYICIKEI